MIVNRRWPEHGELRTRWVFAWRPIRCDDGTTRRFEHVHLQEWWNKDHGRWLFFGAKAQRTTLANYL